MATMQFNNYEFILENESPFSSVHYCEHLKMAICTAEAEYIPIDNFKEMFLFISNLIEKQKIQRLVFDKRKLRTFHQPSMEWYFAVWKTAIKKKGLVNHYKILPNLEWFEKAVEAGKYEIFQKFGKEILNGLTVTYVNSVEEAIDNVVEINAS